MPFQPRENLPDFARLKASFVGARDQIKDYLLFQTIINFLDATTKLKTIFAKQIDDLEADVAELSTGVRDVGNFIPIDGEDGEEGFSFPGSIGPPGNIGPAGSSGGLLIGPPGLDGLDGEEGFTGLPGIQGVKGATGNLSIYKVGVTVDGAGAVVTTGQKGYSTIPVTGTITKARLLADQVGSLVFDVWKDVFANYPPTVADTITASAKPTLSSDDASEDITLTGWTTAVTAGDVLGFNVDSATTITRITLELEITVP